MKPITNSLAALATALRLTAILLSFSILVDTSAMAATFAAKGRPLFNGTDLAGWHGQGEMDPAKLAVMNQDERAAKLKAWDADAREHWTVENGELVNDGQGAFLTTNEEFENFELLAEYKTVPKADSGIYLKATPQVQIWDYTELAKFKLGAQHGSGGLWNNAEGAPGKYPFVLADRPFGEWNRFRIRQVGAKTTVWLNDYLVVDHATMRNYWAPSKPLARSGPLQLQTHGGEIRWKNILVRNLDSDEANQTLADHERVAFRTILAKDELSGWTGAVDDYELTGGVLNCKPNRGGLLLYDRELANFVVRFQFRLPPGGNNGLAIRSPGEGDTAYNGMCELQILDTEHEKFADIDPRQAHGSAYGMVAAERGYLRPTGHWNFQQVTIDGSKIKVELNGWPILDTDLAEVNEYMHGREHPGKNRKQGYFGFAGHHDPVEFRQVMLKELPSEE